MVDIINRIKNDLSKEYSDLKKKESIYNIEQEIENSHFNSSYHQFLIKTTEGQSFLDIKINTKNVVTAFLNFDSRIVYKKEIVHQAFYLLNFTNEVGAFAMMKFLYQHIIPQQLYENNPEFIQNLSQRIISSISNILKDNLEYIPTVKEILSDKLSSWILSLFSFNFRFIISIHTLQQTFLHYSFESIVNTVIGIIILIYPSLKGINYAYDKKKIDGIFFSDIYFSQFKNKVILASSTEDYYKIFNNKTNLNNELWGNDYSQALKYYEEQNKLLNTEIDFLTKECKEYQQNIEEIEKRVIDCEFESVIIPFEDNSNQQQKMDSLKEEQEILMNQIKQKKEVIINLSNTNELILKQVNLMKKQMDINDNENISEKDIEKQFIEEELQLLKEIEELENNKKMKKELVDAISQELQQINNTLELMKQQDNI